jgi:ABC-type transporter Mla MlaB component
MVCYFVVFQKLQVLRCRGCGLSNINTLIYRLLADLQYLDLGDNEFKYIASDEFRDLRNLQVLMLDGNQLPVVLERTFGNNGASGGQIDLQILSLARNRLAKVTAAAFENLTTLQELDISYNKLNHLDTATFVPVAESLRRLKLSGNLIPLSEVKYVLQVVLKLRDLSMADMGITDIPVGLFVYHEHLRNLNLSGNNFVHFPAQTLSPVPKLQEIDLSRNRFRGLDERLILRLEAVKTIHLQGNPWVCDLCHMSYMLNYMNKSTVGVAIRGLTCVSPYSLKGRQLGSLARSSLSWCTSSDGGMGYMESGGGIVSTNFLAEHSRFGLVAAGAAVLLLLLTAAALLAGIAYSRHHAAHYYTREEQRGPEHEAIFENPTAILDENGDVKYKIMPLDITKPPPRKKKVSVSTIDGITKDPEIHSLTNGT